VRDQQAALDEVLVQTGVDQQVEVLTTGLVHLAQEPPVTREEEPVGVTERAGEDLGDQSSFA
jgi:hypothetical protein